MLNGRIAYINSLVHILMYSYYFLSSFKNINSRLNAVKPILTGLQIVQLILLVGESIVTARPSCNTSKVFYFPMFTIGVMVALFAEFYISSYMKKSKKNWITIKFARLTLLRLYYSISQPFNPLVRKYLSDSVYIKNRLRLSYLAVHR